MNSVSESMEIDDTLKEYSPPQRTGVKILDKSLISPIKSPDILCSSPSSFPHRLEKRKRKDSICSSTAPSDQNERQTHMHTTRDKKGRRRCTIRKSSTVEPEYEVKQPNKKPRYHAPPTAAILADASRILQNLSRDPMVVIAPEGSISPVQSPFPTPSPEQVCL